MKLKICDKCKKVVKTLFYCEFTCQFLNLRIADSELCPKCIKDFRKGKIKELPLDKI